MMIQFGVPFAADAERPRSIGRTALAVVPVPVELQAFEVAHRGRAQRGQRGGEPQHVHELLGVALSREIW